MLACPFSSMSSKKQAAELLCLWGDCLWRAGRQGQAGPAGRQASWIKLFWGQGWREAVQLERGSPARGLCGSHHPRVCCILCWTLLSRPLHDPPDLSKWRKGPCQLWKMKLFPSTLDTDFSFDCEMQCHYLNLNPNVLTSWRPMQSLKTQVRFQALARVFTSKLVNIYTSDKRPARPLLVNSDSDCKRPLNSLTYRNWQN